jgi:glycosyltransferase involved in cell wall biosynthesis
VNQTPAVSVIIPVFQDADGVRACLLGLERQSYSAGEFEVIVVDNGSNPPLIIPESGLRNLSVMRCATPGSYAARNAGVLAARSPRLAFTDADCVPGERWLESGVRALDGYGGDVVVGGEVRFRSPAKQTAVSLYQMVAGFPQRDNIEVKGFAATANVFCSRRAFDRIGAFAETLLSGGDLEWAWRARDLGIETIFVSEAVVETLPRSTLRGAIRQARRVAAGRYYLKHYGMAKGEGKLLRPHRGPFASIVWIALHRELSIVDRLRVLTVASLIRLASAIESMRIRCGGKAERR